MSTSSFRTARRLLSAGAIVAAMAAAGTIAQTQSSAGQAVAARAHLLAAKYAIANRSGEPDAPAARGGEGNIMSYEQQQFKMRAFPAKTLDPALYSNATQQYNLVTDFSASLNWKELGPFNTSLANFPDPTTFNATTVSGRVTTLAVAPSTCGIGGCMTIYVGTASGGIWKTVNAGATWKDLTDHLLNLSASSITIDPNNSNTIYVGTGENNQCLGCNHGIGILKSTNGGLSWMTLGKTYFTNRSVSQVLLDPTNTHTMYAAIASGLNGFSPTTGTGYAPNLPERGVYKSTNSGLSWTLLTDSAFGNNRVLSLVMDPIHHLTLYAGVTGMGVYKSTDGGATWGLAGAATQPANITPGYGRVSIAMAPSDHNTLYVGFEVGSGAGQLAMYKSSDAGNTWTQLASAPQSCDGQCWYDLPITIDPANSNTVYVGGSANYGYMFYGPSDPCGIFNPLASSCNTSLMKTTDGGTTWTDVSEDPTHGPIHPDNHIIVVDPHDSNTIYTGTDGGVFVSKNGGSTWTALNNGLNTLQFNNVDVGPDGSIYGGTQDNGTWSILNNGVSFHSNNGDGGDAVASTTDPNVAYYSYYGPYILRDNYTHNLQNGEHWATNNVLNIGAFGNDGSLFYGPRAVDPNDGTILYAGTDRVLRATQGGGTDGNFDGDSTNDASDHSTWMPLSTEGQFCGGDISTIAISAANPNVMAIGTDNGCVFITDNAMATPQVNDPTKCDAAQQPDHQMDCTYTGGINWREIDQPLPGRFVTHLEFSPRSSTTLYAVYGGFNLNDPYGIDGHLFVTNNALTLDPTPPLNSVGTGDLVTWTSLDNSSSPRTSLPDLPYGAFAVNPNNPSHLYIAGDFGVFFSPNAGKMWLRVDYGLPNTIVTDLKYDRTTRTLVAATYGRGIWRGVAP